MPYITAAEYATITGATAPSDFTILEAAAAGTVDDLTLYGYVGRDVSALPALVQQKLKAAVAFQVMLLDDQGLAGANETPVGSASIGKFSYSGAASGSNIAQLAQANIPFLIAYMRGVQKSEADS